MKELYCHKSPEKNQILETSRFQTHELRHSYQYDYYFGIKCSSYSIPV